MAYKTFDDILFEIREEYGTKIFDEPARLKSLLSDLAVIYKKERVELITVLINTGAAAVLKNCTDDNIHQAMSLLLTEIVDDCGYDEATSRRVLETLLLVMKKRRLSDGVKLIHSSSYSNEPKKPETLPALTRGNSTGNIVNSGRVCGGGGWIYYSNKNHDGRLYKMRPDGSVKICLNSERSHYLNIHGDWVFYSNRSDNCRMYAKSITDNRRLLICADGCSYINIVDGWIYYKNTRDGKIYKIRTDGSQRTKISDDRGFYLNVADGWVYYSNWDDNLRLYKLTTAGTERTRLNFSRCFHLNVSGGFIYYSSRNNENRIYKMPVYGGIETQINQHRSGYLNVTGDWIYYSNESDDDKLYKTGINGGTGVKLSNDSCSNISVVGDWIYYINPDSYHNMFKIRTDGTKRQRVL